MHISTPIGIVVIVLLALAVGFFVVNYTDIELPGLVDIVPGETPAPYVPVGEDFAFESFESVEEFRAFLAETNATETSGFGGATDVLQRELARDDAVGAPAPLVAESSVGAEEPSRVSGTNVQVAGIDEPDIVKTNGQEIFLSREGFYYGRPEPLPFFDDVVEGIFAPEYRGETSVIDAFPPADLAEVDSIDMTGDLLLHDDTLIVQGFDQISGYTVANPRTVARSWEHSLDDNTEIVSSRLFEGNVYVVTRTYINHLQPCPFRPLGSITVPCTEIYRPVANTPVDVTYTTFVLSATTGDVQRSISFVGSAGQSVVYMSPNAVYATYTFQLDQLALFADFLNTRGGGLVPSTLIERIVKLQELDISSTAKMVELNVILQNYASSLGKDERIRVETELGNRLNTYVEEHMRELEQTGIVQMDVDTLAVTATGSVPGRLLNQFSLDEYDGHLRVATTVGQNVFFSSIRSSVDSENDVYVLDSGLNTTGSVTGLGKDERIFAVRFLGEEGYVVTFRQIDPFFVIDLSDPDSPRVAGELKIPGFSSYLHPLSADNILGIGREDSQVKLSVFDVSNPNNPREGDKYLLQEFWSDVQNTHHAFLHDVDNGIFFLPAGQKGFIFSYDNGLSLERVVSDVSAQRALYIDNYLYIIGRDAIVVLNEADWQEVNRLNLENR